VIVGLIALAGLGPEIGIVMLLYLDNSYEGFKTRHADEHRRRLAVVVASPDTQNSGGVHE